MSLVFTNERRWLGQPAGGSEVGDSCGNASGLDPQGIATHTGRRPAVTVLPKPA